jgi:hypothetical protein
MMKKLILLVYAVITCTALMAQKEIKLTPDDGQKGDSFGSVLAIYGNYAIIGAHLDNVNGTDSGSAYIFKNHKKGWVQQAKLTPDDGAAIDWFGSVAIFEDYAIVGKLGDDENGSNSGAAYIFKRDGITWTQQTKLTPEDGASGDWFGVLPAIFGNYAIIGAPFDNNAKGAAYVFKRTEETWTEKDKLTPDDGAPGDCFGVALSIYEDYAVIGAPYYENGSGAAYIFKRTGEIWIQEAKLTPNDPTEGALFGGSVSIYQDYVISGAYKADNHDTKSGAAYIFKRTGTTWKQETKLSSSDGSEGDWFGYSVSIHDNYAIVGAEHDDDKGNYSGAAYIFTRERPHWIQQAKLVSNNASEGDLFGSAVACFGNYALIGAKYDDNDDNGMDSGSAFVYDIGSIVSTDKVFSKKLQVNIFPNPAKGTVTISTDEGAVIEKVVLYSSDGKNLMLMDLKSNVVDVSALSPGIYFLEIEIDKKKVVKKLVVQK